MTAACAPSIYLAAAFPCSAGVGIFICSQIYSDRWEITILKNCVQICIFYPLKSKIVFSFSNSSYSPFSLEWMCIQHTPLRERLCKTYYTGAR